MLKRDEEISRHGMTNCIIHIGMHKTGSTSIQNSLQGLRDDHFLYADLGEANHSVAIYTLFSPSPENHHIHKAKGRDAMAMKGYIDTVQAKLERVFEEAENRTVIISGEDIASLPVEALARLQKYFQSRCASLSIVAYVRSPAAYAASSFQERVKHGTIKRINLESSYTNYEKRFRKFDEIFGYENVHLWKFDPELFPNGCVVQDFCERLEIYLPAERVHRINESLHRQAVSLLYTYQKFGQSYGSKTMTAPEAQILGSILTEIGADKFRFSPDVLRPYLEKNNADIEWMEQRLGQSLREELGEHQPGDIRDELDLLNVDPLLLSKLRAFLGDNAPSVISSETSEQVAQLMLALRQIHQDVLDRLKVRELLHQIQLNDSNLLVGIPNEKAVELIQHLFRHMHDNLAETQKGVMEYPGLGQFHINQLTKKIDGKPLARKQIGFRLAKKSKRGPLSDCLASKAAEMKILGRKTALESVDTLPQLNNERNETYAKVYSGQVFQIVKTLFRSK